MVIQDVELREIRLSETNLIKEFLFFAGSSLNSFRYFDKRPLTIISNHVITVLMFKNNQPIGYGHLDRDHDDVWLGIAISELMRGRGYGKILMDYLLKIAKNKNIKEVRLSVDKVNREAIGLYSYFGFIVSDSGNQSIQIMKLKLVKYGE